jgi:glutamine amidotransferase
MCELFALSASAPVDTTLSLGELARHGGETGIHAHGWGVAFLDGSDVRLVRDPSAAAFSPWVQCLQAHPIRSDTVLAHIRHATQGPVTLSNTQPFVRELWGRAHVFAHNGHLGEGIVSENMNGHRFMPIGETDSEVAFCILMERLAAGDASPDHLFMPVLDPNTTYSFPYSRGYSAARSRRRQTEGDTPIAFLNARLNDASDS